MLRGTRIIFGREAELYSKVVSGLRGWAQEYNYSEVIVPSIWEQGTFIDKAGVEILGQMYVFKDKGERDICLIPEVTAIIQELYKGSWSKELRKPVKVFYVQRCYRYERPQAGRYREFLQFGVEILGGKQPDDRNELIDFMRDILNAFKIKYEFSESVQRGLSYYIEDGFEVACPELGAERQILGGGRYDCGIGFAIGVDRLVQVLKFYEDECK